MSRDAKYIIQYEGPFPGNYLEEKCGDYPGYDFRVWGYDTLQGETKHSPDEDIIEIAVSHGDVIQVMRKLDEAPWEEIYRYKK